MRLRLTVSSSSTPELPAGKAWEFGPPGFTIGRLNTDCLLPDDEKRVSRHHAEIIYNAGRYALRDDSHNGTLVNGANVGKGTVVAIGHGDTVEIGPYVLTVALETEIDMPGLDLAGLDGTIEPPAYGAHTYEPPVFVPAASGFGLGGPEADEVEPLAALDRSRPRGSSTFEISEDPFRPADPYPGQGFPGAVTPPHPDSPGVHMHFEPPAALGPQPSDIGDYVPTGYGLFPEKAPEPARPLPPPPMHEAPWAPPAARGPDLQPRAPAPTYSPPTPVPVYQPPPPPPPQATAVAPEGAWHAFLQGVGIQPEDLGPVGDPQTQLVRMGMLFRVLIEGLMDLLQYRARMKAEFRMTQTLVARSDNNPLKFSGNAEDALYHLLGPTVRGFMPAEQAVSDSMRDVKEHEAATVAGVQAALEALIKRFDPEILEKKYQRGAGGAGLAFLNRSGKVWQAYREDYEENVRNLDEHFSSLWGDEFNRAYERLTSAAELNRGAPLGDPRAPLPGRRR